MKCVRIFKAKFGICKTIQFWARISTPGGRVYIFKHECGILKRIVIFLTICGLWKNIYFLTKIWTVEKNCITNVEEYNVYCHKVEVIYLSPD